jgi:hypothetical protein
MTGLLCLPGAGPNTGCCRIAAVSQPNHSAVLKLAQQASTWHRHSLLDREGEPADDLYLQPQIRLKKKAPVVVQASSS